MGLSAYIICSFQWGYRVREIIRIPRAGMIPYFAKLGGELSYLTVEELKKKLGCKYFTESILMDPEEYDKQNHRFQVKPKNCLDLEKFERGIKKLRENGVSGLGIVWMNQKIGHCVIATQDFEEGAVLCLYSGELTTIEAKKDEPDYYCQIIQDDFIVSAQNVRCMAGLMAHLPIDLDQEERDLLKKFQDNDFLAKFCRKPLEELKKEGLLTDNYRVYLAKNTMKRLQNPKYTQSEFDTIKFASPEIKASIAIENVDRRIYSIDGIPVKVLVASRKILKGQMLGFDYCGDYWEKCGATPELFTKTGEIVDHKKYTRLTITSTPSKRVQSPVTVTGDAHERLMERLKKIDPEHKMKPFWDSINNRYYSQALRRICTVQTHALAVSTAKVLLHFKEPLAIQINEQVGVEKKAAIHHAAKIGNCDLILLLLQSGADATLADASGTTADIYLEKFNQGFALKYK